MTAMPPEEIKKPDQKAEVSPSLEPPPTQHHRLKRHIMSILLILVLAVIAAFWSNHNSNKLDLKGGSECVNWAKKIEGSNFSGVHSLDCTLSGPEKISNSSLIAKQLEFSGQPKDKNVCDVIDPGFSPGTLPPDYKYCVYWHGT